MLLFDENLPPSLTARLSAIFPGCVSVYDLGLGGRPDSELAAAASTRKLVIVTKDRDFPNYVALQREGLKVVWLRTGNCTPATVLSTLEASVDLIRSLIESEEHRI